jgi:hypothetical protein
MPLDKTEPCDSITWVPDIGMTVLVWLLVEKEV